MFSKKAQKQIRSNSQNDDDDKPTIALPFPFPDDDVAVADDWCKSGYGEICHGVCLRAVRKADGVSVHGVSVSTWTTPKKKFVEAVSKGGWGKEVDFCAVAHGHFCGNFFFA